MNNKEENISIVCDQAKELYGELYEEAKEILKAKARIEAIKEFANRLKCGVSIISGIITCEDIDTLVKEMTEG